MLTIEQTLEWFKINYPNLEWELEDSNKDFPSFFAFDKENKLEISLCKEFNGWSCDVILKESDDTLLGISTTFGASAIETTEKHFEKIRNEMNKMNSLFGERKLHVFQ